MKKLFFLISICFILAVPCFADNTVYFANPLIVTVDSTTTYNCNFNSDGYFFIRWYDANHSMINIYGISETRYTPFTCNNSSGNTSRVFYSNYYYDNVQLMVPVSNIALNPNIAIYEHNTQNNVIESDFANFLENPVIPETGHEVTFTLPRGNVLYFKVSSNQDVHFESDFMSNSALFSSGTYGPWGDTQQRFGAVSTLPSSSTVFPISSQSPITWYKSPNQNILGQTKTGRASVSCVSGQYYCFYNPAFSYVSDSQERDSVGGTVRVNGTFSEIKIYPLSQKLSIEDGQILMNSGSNDDYTSYFDGSSNENGTVTFTDQDGNISLPVNGGQNQQDAPVTAQGLIESIKGTLQNILREIESLFTFGYEAIQTLVSTISDFTSVFSQLYTWLPSPVYQALISAIIIAITIGVFKVFL